MTDEQLKKYWEMYTEAWKLFKEFAEPVESDEYWMELRAKGIELDKKYDSVIMRKLAVTTIECCKQIFETQEKSG